MRLGAITRFSVTFAFIAGAVFASASLMWQALLAPYLVPPNRPSFTNQTDNLYKDRVVTPVFMPPPQPKPFVPKPSEVKYQGQVNVSRGLVLRIEPRQGSKRTGGVEYKAKVSILKETPDKEWVYIRVESSKQIGWVRSGNIFKN
jgi:hypothetical protein